MVSQRGSLMRVLLGNRTCQRPGPGATGIRAAGWRAGSVTHVQMAIPGRPVSWAGAADPVSPRPIYPPAQATCREGARPPACQGRTSQLRPTSLLDKHSSVQGICGEGFRPGGRGGPGPHSVPSLDLPIPGTNESHHVLPRLRCSVPPRSCDRRQSLTMGCTWGGCGSPPGVRAFMEKSSLGHSQRKFQGAFADGRVLEGSWLPWPCPNLMFSPLSSHSPASIFPSKEKNIITREKPKGPTRKNQTRKSPS